MLDPDRPFLISPPFGTYFRSKRAYSVFGSFTRYPRPARTMQVLRTVRPLGRELNGEPKGWVNKVGLRNAGWESIGRPTWKPHQIASLALVEGDALEWCALREFLVHGNGVYLRHIEVNVSCPNTGHPAPALPDDLVLKLIIDDATGHSASLIWKLPPVPASVDAALRLAGLGARYIHLSNTLPSPVGGMSGRILREVNLSLVERAAVALDKSGHRYNASTNGWYNELKRTLPHGLTAVDVTTLPSLGGRRDDALVFAKRRGWIEFVTNTHARWVFGDGVPTQGIELIAGGGILAPEHVRQYRDSGATRFSLATAFFWPPRAYRVMKEYKL